MSCSSGVVLNVDVLQLICYVNAVSVPKGSKHKQQRFSSSDAGRRGIRTRHSCLWPDLMKYESRFQRHELHLSHKYLNDSRIIKAKVDKWSRKSRFDGGWVGDEISVSRAFEDFSTYFFFGKLGKRPEGYAGDFVLEKSLCLGFKDFLGNYFLKLFQVF